MCLVKFVTSFNWIIFAAALVTVGCGKDPGNGSLVAQPSVNDSQLGSLSNSPGAALPPPPLPPAATLPSEPPSPVIGVDPAAWSSLPVGRAWTAVTLAAVTENLSSFERAADKQTYCPGYSRASLAQRKICWVRLVSAVAEYESDFNPTNKYQEANGSYSVGLLQLSTGECAGATSIAGLQNPANNLRCGTRKMAALIESYGYVTSPDNLHGAAAYWSTLRRPYVSGNHHLGKALLVQKFTKNYLAVDPSGFETVSEFALNSLD